MGKEVDQHEVAIWRRYDEIEARLTAPVSERMVELAGLRAGMRVLDVATGRGEPAIPAAHRVGPNGSVVGLDRNDGLLDMARERARREGLVQIDFRVADAESFEVDSRFDAAFCRWGLMYFANPDRALACIRRALAPGAPLVLALWGGPEEVEYAGLPRRVLARFREVPPMPPDAPGVFRFAEPKRLETTLNAAGFSVESIEERWIPVIETSDGAGFVQWVRAFKFAFNALVDELPDTARRDWERALAEEAEKFRSGDTIQIGGITRIVVARPS